MTVFTVIWAVRRLKLWNEKTCTPIAVITNGSLLWDAAVQDALKNADLVMPSLDAGDAGLFHHVNRPHSGISFELMLKGLVDFRKVFKNKLWLEVLLVGDSPDIMKEVRKIAKIIRTIQPDKGRVNTVVRPPSEDFAHMVPPAQLKKMAALLGKTAEVIAEFSPAVRQHLLSGTQEDILVMLRRRPCTLDDIVEGLSINWNIAVKQVDYLIGSGRISVTSRKNRTFYSAGDGRPPTHH